jgi:hypothetical protein
MVMRYPVRTRSTWRTCMGDVHHDERSGTDFHGWLYARRCRRCDVDAAREYSAEKVTRLHDCVNDLVRIAGPTLRRCHYDVTICVPPQRPTYYRSSSPPLSECGDRMEAELTGSRKRGPR